MRYRTKSLLLIALCFVFITSGCAMKRPLDTAKARDNLPTPQSKQLLSAAENCFDSAGDLEAIKQCRSGYRAVLDENPGDYAALTKLSTLNILLGTAYTDGLWAKSARFRKAMDYAEQAMLTNDSFRQRVETGTPLWEAVDALGKAELEAMFFWVTALQYDFKEGMTLAGKIANIEWLQRALVVLNRIEEIDPTFGGGGVEFAKVICYYALPARYGGSKSAGDEYMHKAVSGNDHWLLPRWARGKYYYVITEQPEKSQEELSWVARQNPADYRDPYPWRKHFFENAEELLK